MKLQVECFICHSVLLVDPYRLKCSKSGRLFCSRKCTNEAISKRLIRTGKARQLVATPAAGNARARRDFPDAPCEICGVFPAQRHHKDGNPLNNVRENIAMLCPKHHIHADRLELLTRISKLGGAVRAQTGIRDAKGKFCLAVVAGNG